MDNFTYKDCLFLIAINKNNSQLATASTKYLQPFVFCFVVLDGVRNLSSGRLL